jgi:hypothetical protein
VGAIAIGWLDDGWRNSKTNATMKMIAPIPHNPICLLERVLNIHFSSL